MNINDPIKVRLTNATDMNRPIVEAKVVRVNGVGAPQVVVVERSAHAVWGGCQLSIPEQCRRVR